MNGSNAPFALAAGVAVAAFGLDQATKALAIANADLLSGGLAVFPGFNLVLHRNSGVSFGMFGDLPPLALVGLALAIVAWVAVLAFRSGRRSDAAGYGLIMGGALGNVADRLRLGGVTDFLDFYIGTTHWPAFNLADTAIFCGAVILLFWPRRGQAPTRTG
ncbi:signal peptidase II [Palleronia rufa]|uniref:signal peptidase II n=1 Tax=Palleronia rufa TaxID=1530186 RepID=UPI0006911A71|nr:signal peptidase II [Palleronia rufa]